MPRPLMVDEAATSSLVALRTPPLPKGASWCWWWLCCCCHRLTLLPLILAALRDFFEAGGGGGGFVANKLLW